MTEDEHRSGVGLQDRFERDFRIPEIQIPKDILEPDPFERLGDEALSPDSDQRLVLNLKKVGGAPVLFRS